MRHLDLLKKVILEVIVFLFLLLSVLWFIHNYYVNTSHIYQPLDFTFLFEPSQFFINQAWYPIKADDSMMIIFLSGLLNTLVVSVAAIILSSLIGLVIGLLPFLQHNSFKSMNMKFVSLFRNVPLYIQLLTWYFGIFYQLPKPEHSLHFLHCFLNIKGLYFPSVFFTTMTYVLIVLLFIMFQVFKKNRLLICFLGFFVCAFSLRFSFPTVDQNQVIHGYYLSTEFLSLWLALSFYSSAYIAEIIKGAIRSVPKGQFEGAKSLGLSFTQQYQYIILPQALPIMRPVLTNQYINIFKNSSLGALIGYPELLGITAGTMINQTSRNLEVMMITLCIYFSICQIITFLFRQDQ